MPSCRSFVLLSLLLLLFSGLVVACSGGGGDDDDRSGDDDDDNVLDDDATDDDAADDDATDDDNDDNDDDDDTVHQPTPGFATIPAGTFTMGSPTDELGHEANEALHAVTLTHEFEIGLHETTQQEFVDVLGWNPSHFGPNGSGAECGDNCPAETMSWFDVVVYANEFSTAAGYDACFSVGEIVCQDNTSVGANFMECMNATQQGIKAATVALIGVTSVYDCEGYRLPTEAEWEYSARAGRSTAFYSGEITQLDDCSPLDPNLDTIAWYCGNGGATTEEVGQKALNAWGLSDMSGNVWEWIWDWNDQTLEAATDPEGPINGTDRVDRGGSWGDVPQACRSANRRSSTPGARGSTLGFRLAKSL
jgi:formylglycine-generating enzyme required for sulfatase activity